MSAAAGSGIQPEKTPEILSLTPSLTPQSLLVTSFVIALLVVFLGFLLNRNRLKSKGNTVLLVGPPDAGKTAILSQLAYGRSFLTQTSMQVNSSMLTLSNNKTIRVIDVPGHARIRSQFSEFIAETKVVAFVVDASTVSRNAPAVAEHLHHILHALTSLPPSQHQPILVILAHKSDMFKSTSSNLSTGMMAVNRVKSILERELEKRRVSQTGGVNVEGLGEEGERSDMGGLECGEKEGSTFKFDEWEGGEITFLGTSTALMSGNSEKESVLDGLQPLWELLEEVM